jgi:molecular chaperone GrpE
MSEQSGEHADPAAKGTPGSGADPAGEADGRQDHTAGPAGDLAEALRQAEAEAAENWNKYLRAVAEMENLRKRMARDVDSARRSGIEKLAAEILPVADSLEMALESGAQATAEALLDGKAATLRLLQSALERLGIEVLDPLGEPFDPQLHEAMSMQPAPAAEPGSVIAVLQKGYRLQDRLLRPARVVVAGQPDLA